MTFKRDGFFLTESILSKEDSIYIEDKKIEKCIKYIKKNNIHGVILNSEYGFNSQDISFLKEIPSIKELSILNKNINTEPVNNLKQLQYLFIQHECKQELFFENFKQLKECSIPYNNKIRNFKDCTSLEFIIFQKYLEEDLTCLSQMINLKSLYLFDSKMNTLNGIENCIRLEKLEIERARKLNNIDAIGILGSSIKDLAFRGCKSIEGYEVIRNCINLESLYLINSAPTQSISFFEALHKLKYANIDIDIIDGNVDFLLEKPVIFKNYKHFSHKNNLKIKIEDDGNYLVRDGKITLGKL